MIMSDKIKAERTEEIKYICELLQACLQEEGYEIPRAQYAANGWKAFDVPLKNAIHGKDNLFIRIEFNNYE